MKTSNPVLREDVFTKSAGYALTGEVMTIQGTANKAAILLLLAVIPAIWVWDVYFQAGPQAVLTWMAGGAIVGLVLSLITVFKMDWSPVTAPLYAIAEGLFLGGISASFESKYPGIAFQAITLTFGTLLCLLLAYRSGIIKVTQKFMMGVVAATGAIFLVYFASFVLSLFHVPIPGIFGNGIVGIGFSIVVVVIAALNLVLDFEFIVQGTRSRAPKYMEWYGAFGLMVTIIWLYIEILRLLAKLSDRR